MKRLMMIFAVIVMAFTVVSCDKKEEPNNDKDSTNDSEIITAIIKLMIIKPMLREQRQLSFY